MMTVELEISVKILWRILFLIQFFFIWHRLTSHMAYCWTLHQLKGKHLWLTLENTKLCLWAGSGWKCSWQMEIVMSFLFHCSTGRRHFLHWAIYIKVYFLRGQNIPLLISCSIFLTGNGFQIRHSALNGTWGNRNPFPALASRFKNQMAPSFTEQNPWPEKSPAPWPWNHTQGTFFRLWWWEFNRTLENELVVEIWRNGHWHISFCIPPPKTVTCFYLLSLKSSGLSRSSGVKVHPFFQILALWTRKEMEKDSPEYFTQKQVWINEQQITPPPPFLVARLVLTFFL